MYMYVIYLSFFYPMKKMMFPFYNLTTAGCLAEAGKPG